MSADLVVIEGGFGRNKTDDEDNAFVIAELEKWIQRAKDRKIVAFTICAVAADEHVMTQYAPSKPRNVFSLFGGASHVALRVWNDGIDK